MRYARCARFQQNAFVCTALAEGTIMFEHKPVRSALSQNMGGKYLAFALLVLGLSACTAGSTDAQQAAQSGGVSVFALGFWHGLIAPITLLVEVINEFATGALPWAPRMYQEGGGVVYDLGFFIGIIAGPSILWTGSLRRR
jgi:hypothetical protein